MTATEVFESVTNGGSSDFALLVSILNHHGRWCLMRILEAYPETRKLMPREIGEQVPESAM